MSWHFLKVSVSTVCNNCICRKSMEVQYSELYMHLLIQCNIAGLSDVQYEDLCRREDLRELLLNEVWLLEDYSVTVAVCVCVEEGCVLQLYLSVLCLLYTSVAESYTCVLTSVLFLHMHLWTYSCTCVDSWCLSFPPPPWVGGTCGSADWATTFHSWERTSHSHFEALPSKTGSEISPWSGGAVLAGYKGWGREWTVSGAVFC